MVCNFSRVAFFVFGYPVHWYSLAYIFGLLIAVYITNWLAKKSCREFQKEFISEFIDYAIVGIILGGRLGHVLLYDFDYYAANPEEILKIWKGGMSFYGGFSGVIAAAYLFCRSRDLAFLKFMDLWTVSVPIGLFLGRVANFINGELLGKKTDVAWAVIFRDGAPRHPSQLYEAFCEGILLFILLLSSFFHGNGYRESGRLCGTFCAGYGIARFVCEFFREVDSEFSSQLLLATGMNINQYMSIGLFMLGIYLLYGRQTNYGSGSTA
ncbi:MAG: prolipoprotein diacylglyceryl transferase [Holosporaceae bacterium]|jgi:phosphatidylglycerol:prolipoprotein diacylglycerol transferase|nr:prolipoprotein diacylglyceryl transferase [Holosporaceae bacterium]